MTRIPWFLYLTTTLSFALLAAGNSNCPSQHPYAFDNGKRCCKTNWESQPDAPKGQGIMLSYSSSSCEGNQYVKCPMIPCKNYGGCNSKACTGLVKMTNDFMDTTANPCNSFGQFVCGKYVKNLKIPGPFAGFLASFGGEARVVFNRTKKILEELPTKQTKFKSDILLSDLYQSCIDVKQIEKLKFSPLENVLNKYGGFPVLLGPRWNQACYDMWEHATTLAANGVSPNFLLALNVDIDEKKSTRRTLSLDQAELPYPPGAYGVDAFRALYYKYMVDSVKLMGAKNCTAHREMKEVLQFETELAKISTSGRTDLNVFYNKRTLEDLEGKPGYPPSIITYINKIFADAGVVGVMVGRNDTVIVKNLEYAKKLSEIIRVTPDRTIANYLSWRTYHEVTHYLHKDSRMAFFNLGSKFTGEATPWETWRRCILELGTLLPSKKPHSLSVLATSIYARNHFPKEKLKRPNKIVDDVTSSFRYMLERREWMDPQTKAYAIKKLDRMRSIVAYTDDIFKPDVIDDFFKGVNMKNGYFQNKLSLARFWRKRFYEKLRVPVRVDLNDLTRDIPVVMVNAFYENARNLMHYSVAIFNGIFFNEGLPDILNLATMGMVTGHETLHGFDDQGRLYGSEGNLFNWWQNSTDQKFRNRTDCIIKQYNNYVHPQVNMSLNGFNTQGENIADTGGLMAAYSAFQKARNPKDPFLVDGQYYSEDQWFFLRYGHLFCGKNRDAALRFWIAHSAHPPAFFRINGPVSNNPDFAKAFRCPPGSPMNPVKKCPVW